MYNVQCTMYYVLCTMYYVLCTMYYVLCTMYYVYALGLCTGLNMNSTAYIHVVDGRTCTMKTEAKREGESGGGREASQV